MVTLGKLAAEVGRDWKMVARYLGLDETTIDSISRAHQDSLHEAALQSLRKWVGRGGVEVEVWEGWRMGVRRDGGGGRGRGG